jgi:hypothetical protein
VRLTPREPRRSEIAQLLSTPSLRRNHRCTPSSRPSCCFFSGVEGFWYAEMLAIHRTLPVTWTPASLLIFQTKQTLDKTLAFSVIVHHRFSIHVGRRSPSFVSDFHSASVCCIMPSAKHTILMELHFHSCTTPLFCLVPFAIA